MIEILAAVSLLAVIGLAVCGYMIVQLREKRNEALQDLTIERGDVRSLTSRCTTLRGEVIAQQKSIDLLREGHDRLVDERDNAVRKLGRIEAERRADMMALPCEQKPGTITVPVNRDPATGRFARKPQPAKPIACG